MHLSEFYGSNVTTWLTHTKEASLLCVWSLTHASLPGEVTVATGKHPSLLTDGGLGATRCVCSSVLESSRNLQQTVWMRCDPQMADPDSPSPAEVPQGGQASMVPPDSSCDARPSGSAPSPDTELQAGGQGPSCAPERTLSPGLKSQTGPGGEEDVAAGPHQPIGGQSLVAVSHMTAAASCPTMASSVRKQKQPQEALCCSDVAGRRTLLLSNEARRQIAKQARAMKEERRAALDGRHQYLIGRLVDAGTLQQLEVEDALICDDKFGLIDDFFAANGSKKLIFFYQSVKQNLASSHPSIMESTSAVAQRKLFLSTGSSEPLLGKCLFFLRTTDKEITTANIQQEVNLGVLDCSDGGFLSRLETLLAHIMLPALRSQQTWGSVQDAASCPHVHGFLSSVDRFVGNLSSARINLERKFQLQQVELPDAISQLSSPADYTCAANNSELVEHLEGVALVWANQIKQVLTESEQMRKEADDVGPSAELEHWKRRMVTFNSLMEEVKRPEVKRTLGVLQVARSRMLRVWRELDGDITVVANEAKDNVKYLSTLDKFFGPPGKSTPTSMLQHIPSLMSSIRMIHGVSQHHHTSDRMTALLLRVTNHMMATCRSYLTQGVSRLWDLSRPTLLQRISDCCRLKVEYQRSFQSVRDKLRENPEQRQFDFSENYIFGKFDAFCRHLEKIADMASTLESLAALQNMKVEGVEKIYVRYQNIVSTTESKTYDILDHRRLEFDSDFSDFQFQVQSVFESLQSLLEFWFCRVPLEEALQQLLLVRSGPTARLDLQRFYLLLLQRYSRELELLRRTYQRQRDGPPIGRNLPPVAGRILWCRQLFRRAEAPMLVLKKQLDVLQGSLLAQVIRSYNRTAVVLLQYEALHLQGWSQAAEGAPPRLSAALLVRHHNSKALSVNLDPVVLEVLQEARWMSRLGVTVPQAVLRMASREEPLRALYSRLLELLQDYSSVLGRIPPLLLPVLQPLVSRVEAALSPGLTTLSWTAGCTDGFVDSVYEALTELDQAAKLSSDLLDCRIGRLLQSMSSCCLLLLPEDSPVSPEELLQQTDRSVQAAAAALSWQSQQVEKLVFELIEELKRKMKTTDAVHLQGSFHCLQPDSRQKTRCLSCLPCRFYNLIGQLCHRTTEALVTAVRSSLEALRRRLSAPHPLLRASVQLCIPVLELRPSLDQLQTAVNQLLNILLSVANHIPLWSYAHLQLRQQQVEQAAVRDAGEDVQVKAPVLRPLDRQLAEHRDVCRLLVQLGSIMSVLKAPVVDALNELGCFSALWTQVPEQQLQMFLQNDPSLLEFSSHICLYSKLEDQISELPPFLPVGSVLLDTDRLKLALAHECRLWKRAFGGELNRRASADMNAVFSLVEGLTKRLQRPITDLEDVREAMAALREVREEEVRIDTTIGPVEESFALLSKHQLLFTDGNAERLDGLMYAWKNLNTLVVQTQNILVKVEPSMKAELLSAMQIFQSNVHSFCSDYNLRGPGVVDGAPAEASERLQSFQAEFEQLWNKYTTYSAGEELFGLPPHEFPELLQIRKELSLLSRLYSLYNSVTNSVSGYYDLLWAELNIDKIITELQDFQNRIRKLPKALKEWQAFRDLKKSIDDFTETCPLLHMMANKAMLPRHWTRLGDLTGHNFQVESETFSLRNIMEAPLLENKEDIEDVCISAVKEQDIEAKLKDVAAEWSSRMLSFATFRTRGELLLRGADTAENISMMEDSLMVLTSLLSNRYNAPFKASIQLWVQKLSNTSETVEKWLSVQNLWIYLEAVFVGGDIAKQLPQEAKRFQNIDRSWQKIMQRAHELPNVVQCCVGDETLSQLLPHLLEQLELCQKSLSGYLENKRLLFPRFFFVSDPALLEILGQASDSHTIQTHLLSLFDNVSRVVFSETFYDQMISFQSQEGESVELQHPVLAQGSVEVWLGQLLAGVRLTLHAIIRQAHLAISEPGMELLELQSAFPAQVGLLGIQMIWTRDAEEALGNSKSDKKIMQTTNQRFLDVLNQLIDVTTRELSRNERTKYETLITIHVHQRDIFDELVHLNVRSASDFEWQKQSRFYFLEEADRCVIQITDVEFSYCNEYLGCTDRLVITPLTDRCYITLAQALGMSMGGAPAGPAGTGKTETTKDMGRCLGKYVVVFNCSDQMDYRGLGRIYKGLAQSGSWGCFDEFNRIELPVLSVAAQQIYIVLQCKKNKKEQFVFTDGDVVNMDPEFGIFLTMNPGYAGRQELPENLKIQFRTVAMMVPDRAIIMRVKLASAGFRDNQVLSRKFYTLYKLCEEQLSKQVHYDFGLRNILSVLRTLGAVKRSNPSEAEQTVVMRVLRDMNLSKLVDEDEPLFMSLINDLFPGIVLDKAGYPDLEVSIVRQAQQAGLIPHPPWILKLVQLYETQRVRHGMMALGPSGSGKSSCIHTLMRAMAECGAPHREMRMNPKAVTASQMFGSLDVTTNDWTDGVFSTLWRRTLKAKKGENIWIVLDGPVDAIWIENLNSVLDDNKTLTLANGDRIPMAPCCKIVFEPHNIDNASPATVSRNGMVFMSSSVLGWSSVLQAWLQKLPEQQADCLKRCFDCCYQDLLDFVFTAVTPKMQLLECMYIRQTIDLLQGLLLAVEDRQGCHGDMGRLFVLAVMWSLGALLELEDRAKMEAFLKGYSSSLDLPPSQDQLTMFEFCIGAQGQWESWSNQVPEYIYPRDHVPDYRSILVPNVDNVRMDFLMRTVMKQGKAVLLIGEQGTAKTVTVKSFLGKLDPELHLGKTLNFSSATLPSMFQRTIESYVDKRMGATYGPPAGRRMTVFIDDINMPVVNQWGDQITNEIVRQLMEQGGFYSLDRPGEFITVVDIQLVAAMIHPGSGRNDIPQRLKRHFCIFNCTLPSDSSIDKIFGTVAQGYFCPERGFPQEVCELAAALVASTRRVWQTVKAKMLPSPAKFHYIFNLRDLSRIWQGILTVKPEVCRSSDVLAALFHHECSRVISDRFVDGSDRRTFSSIIQEITVEDHGRALTEHAQWDSCFVDFLREAPEATGDEPEDPELEAPKVYEPVPSPDVLAERLSVFQQQYNEAVRGGAMDLVFFKDAMTHLMRVSRILRTPQGNALLVGVGGSGKQSLTRLASFIAGYQTFQITLTRSYSSSNLLEDLKFLYQVAGQQGKGVTFIFTDADIKDESFLEYMNNVLASGEVSNLFARDELDDISQDLVPVMKRQHPRRAPTPEHLHDFFLSRVRSNLHVVLCFSPIGDKFRTRALKFPGLISGCTVDWFQRWPRDALTAVSHHFLSQYQDLRCSEDARQSVVVAMGTFQDLVAEKCGEYFERFRRLTFVTPKSYLSFIDSYKVIYSEKIAHVGMLAERMNTGLSKLMEAEQSVSLLSDQLLLKEQELAVTSQRAEGVLQEVTAKAQAAEKVKQQVQKVKDKAQLIVDEIEADKTAAESKLEAARPALEAAEAALQTIRPADISTVRKLQKPPHLIMRIMDAVLLLFQRKIEPVTADPERPCPRPSWAEAMKLMQNSSFLNMLLNFSKDSITEEVVELLAPYLDMDDYNMESAKRICGNVAGLCSWTQAMVDFFSINKEVLPLKANLALQEARLLLAQAELAKAQDQLDAKQQELDAVQALYDAAMKEKQDLLDDAQTCRRKMSNATALIDGLGGEKVRWTDSSARFQTQIRRLVGDVLLSSGFLSYAGPFNQEYRHLLLELWKQDMEDRRIPFSPDLDVIGLLVDSTTVSEWNLQGLPSDDLSVQNGIVVTKASRYPLLIDPQGQAKTWIQNREREQQLQVTSLNHKYFRSHLEDSLSLGRPLLLEDVGEELDPVLDNILDKNYIRSGSTYKVKIGDKEVDVMKGFRLYITTKLANPAYSPEVSARTAVVDFTVTQRGLEDQLLGRVILLEKQELEAERVKLLEEVTSNRRRMQELEDSLLLRLTSTQGSLVEDESLIQVLRVTKSTAQEVSEKLSVAAETEVKITQAREEYRPVATRGSILYFLIVEMSLVNIMYQTSLRQFLGLFDSSLMNSEKNQLTSRRIGSIIDFLTCQVFCYTTRGLYEEHKLLFTLLLALKIDLQARNISQSELLTFIKGGASLDLNSVESKPRRWILDQTWLNLVQLSFLSPFSRLLVQVNQNERSWRTWFDQPAPEEALLPDGYEEKLDAFRKLLLIRSWCPDRTIAQARCYISESLGRRYAEGSILDLEALVAESDCRTPMVCLLSMGSDPTENIEKLAKSKGAPCRPISLGQGQEVYARRLLASSMTDGGWLLLQNCHLGLDFLDELLEMVTAATPESVHRGFRVWLTTDVHNRFPITFLQSSIKFTNEPPLGMKAGLKRTFGGVSQDQLEVSSRPEWRPLLYAVAFLHTTVQERRKFGPLGWNVPYEFNQADFTSSIQFIQNHLDELDAKRGVNWSCLRYMLGEVQYGGRVTDDLDKRLLNTFTRVWFSENTFSDKFCFYRGYGVPSKARTVQDVLQHIEVLPLVDSPEVLGLHPNADITYQTNLANQTLSTIVSIQPKDGGGGAGETREAGVRRLANEMLEKLPPDYIPHQVKGQLQKMGPLQPMSIFLRQEVERMQRIISSVRSTLNDLILGIDGSIMMSQDLRGSLDCLSDCRVPGVWFRLSWPSSSLGFWFSELLERNHQLVEWIGTGRPNQFWLTGFFNPQGFLTAMRQETTRSNLSRGWALDTVTLSNDVTKMMREDVSAPPPEDVGGVYIYGLFLDGAGWDRRGARLSEAPPKVLFTPLPVVHVYAVSGANMADRKQPGGHGGSILYSCPVYKKPQRTDQNFIFCLQLRSVQPADHWTLRGTALLCDCKRCSTMLDGSPTLCSLFLLRLFQSL
ncbi:dynein axonemal heavy chain 5 isoform X2 [Amphiprion ocellaris]|uniref:dynein axonemal heavy chain 5 isoform X2 n=2 Tax=Amphiprion ocellaris TaxID=80972 RepID=UPI0024115DD1|nr:dynein axonemal heavy chain 5 isoform X2 [Amphiprion ocellaris]